MATVDLALPPEYPREYGLLLATLQATTAGWRRQLAHPSREAIVWQARPGGHSIGSLLLHIADVELHWAQGALGREVSEEDCRLLMSAETQQYDGIWPTPPAEDLAWYLAILDDVRTRTLDAVKEFGAPEDGFAEPGGNTYTFRWIIAHLVEHESYHGGQAVLLNDLHAHSV